MNWIMQHKIIAIVIVVTLATGAWYFLSGTSAPPSVLTTAPPSTAPAGAQDLVDSLLALRAVSLDGTILSSPSFQALQDFSTPITPEPAGRTNPFAPLGSDVVVGAAAASAAKSTVPKH